VPAVVDLPRDEDKPLEPPASNARELPSLAEQLRKAHEEADAAHSNAAKLASAEQLLALDKTLGENDSPHLIALRQDLAARAAELLLQQTPARARESALRGLSLSSAPSVLRANLLLALADAEEALKNEDQTRKALVEALSINEKLFESEMQTP
jgi:hypothetical protein